MLTYQHTQSNAFIVIFQVFSIIINKLKSNGFPLMIILNAQCIKVLNIKIFNAKTKNSELRFQYKVLDQNFQLKNIQNLKKHFLIYSVSNFFLLFLYFFQTPIQHKRSNFQNNNYQHLDPFARLSRFNWIFFFHFTVIINVGTGRGSMQFICIQCMLYNVYT